LRSLSAGEGFFWSGHSTLGRRDLHRTLTRRSQADQTAFLLRLGNPGTKSSPNVSERWCYLPVIREVFWCHRRRYGARRIAVELSSRGIACGVARVARLLKTQGFRAIQPQSYRPRTTASRHRLGDNQNLLAGRARPTRINEVWVGDITYIPLPTRTSSGRFRYLALLMVLCSRRIVGWEYGTSMSEDLVLSALRRAIQERQPDVGLIHHTDRGGQYASRRYRDVLRRSAIQQSMSAAESCYATPSWNRVSARSRQNWNWWNTRTVPKPYGSYPTTSATTMANAALRRWDTSPQPPSRVN